MNSSKGTEIIVIYYSEINLEGITRMIFYKKNSNSTLTMELFSIPLISSSKLFSRTFALTWTLLVYIYKFQDINIFPEKTTFKCETIEYHTETSVRVFSVFLVPEHKDEQHFYKLSSTCRVTLIKIWSDRSSGDGKDIAAYFFLLIYLRLSGVLARCLDFRQFKPGCLFLWQFIKKAAYNFGKHICNK